MSKFLYAKKLKQNCLNQETTTNMKNMIALVYRGYTNQYGKHKGLIEKQQKYMNMEFSNMRQKWLEVIRNQLTSNQRKG